MPVNHTRFSRNYLLHFVLVLLLPVAIVQHGYCQVSTHSSTSRIDSTSPSKVSFVCRLPATFAVKEPLYILDGQPIDSTVLSKINPDDIKSLQILKDTAAVALYGTRAANGVILITSKITGGVKTLPYSVALKSLGDSTMSVTYLVNGILTSYTKMQYLNPNNIRSINVLKNTGPDHIQHPDVLQIFTKDTTHVFDSVPYRVTKARQQQGFEARRDSTKIIHIR